MKQRYLETLKFVQKYQTAHLSTPSLKEISDELGITPAGISLRIKALAEEGFIERVGNRALRITGKGYNVIQAASTNNLVE